MSEKDKRRRLWSARKIAAILTGLAAIVAAALGVSWAFSSQSRTSTVSGNSIGGAVSITLQNGCVSVQGSGSQECSTDSGNVLSSNEIEVLKRAADNGGAPKGSGPWMFFVVNTGSANGEYVRDGYLLSNHRIKTPSGQDALLLEGTPVFVDCYANGWSLDSTSTWDWTKGQGGGRWFKVRYPEAADAGNYWMYSAWWTFALPLDLR